MAATRWYRGATDTERCSAANFVRLTAVRLDSRSVISQTATSERAAGGPVRILHLDIKTRGNYGDTLLFECVRQLFNGFGGGKYFRVDDTYPLRHRAGPRLIGYANSEFDAVLIGGGGLFLRDTNPNVRSGWQWDISIPLLKDIQKPIIVFGVGNNRFYGQPEFDDIFVEHIGVLAEKTVFFGLRNHGSITTIGDYLSSSRDLLRYQPCPTVLGEYLFPDLMRQSDQVEQRRIGVQALIGERHVAAGFDRAEIFKSLVNVLRRLAAEGWLVDGVSHNRDDELFVDAMGDAQLDVDRVSLHSRRHLLYRGVEYYGQLPIMIGMRGHAQMIPFGLGGIPIGVRVHPKIGYFADEIGRPEWAIDPRSDDFERVVYETVRTVHERRLEETEYLSRVRRRLFELTLENLSSIYASITGRTPMDTGFVPYSERERWLALVDYEDSMARWRMAARVKSLRAEFKGPVAEPEV